MDPAPPPPPEPERDAAAEAEAVAAEQRRTKILGAVRRARGWILGIGILIYVVNVGLVWSSGYDFVPAWLRYQISLLQGIILLAYVALWWFAQKKPRLCCILALALYWGLQGWLAWITKNPSSLIGDNLLAILFKAGFTFALVKGILTAHQAERMRADLPTVFG